MKKKILSVIMLATLSLTTYAVEFPSYIPMHLEVADDNVMDIEVVVNGNSFKMIDVPTRGYIEVYSILGVKVTTLILDKSKPRYDIPVTLPKGVYIIKAGKVSQKVIAR